MWTVERRLLEFLMEMASMQLAGSEPLTPMQRPFLQQVELSFSARVASQLSALQEEWFAYLRLDQSEPVLGVDLVVVAGNPAALVGSHHIQGMDQEESLVLVGETSQVGLHKASEENRPGLEVPHDPIHLEDLEGRMVGIVGDGRKTEHLGVRGLAVEDQTEDLVVDAAEKLGLEVEDVNRSVWHN
jgi:hypothetical protein